MTKEQEEAIEDLKSLSPSESSIDKVLFLIKEQQKEWTYFLNMRLW